MLLIEYMAKCSSVMSIDEFLPDVKAIGMVIAIEA